MQEREELLQLDGLDEGKSPVQSARQRGVLVLCWILLIVGTTQPSAEKISAVVGIYSPTVSMILDIAKYLGIFVAIAVGARVFPWSLMWPSLIFVSLMALSIPASVDLVQSTLTVVMMCLTVYTSVRFGSSLKAGQLIIGAVIGLLFVLVPSLFLLRETIYAPVTGVFGTRNELARITSYCAGLSFAGVWIVQGKRTRMFLVCVFVFSTGFCVYTGSATALTTLLLFIFSFVLFASVKWPLGPVKVASFAFLGAFTLLIAPIAYTAFFTLTGRDLTFTGRTDIWDYAWRAVSERPIFGYGAEAFWSSADGQAGRVTLGDAAVHSHNTWIELYLSLGVIGGSFAVLVLCLQVLRFLGAIASRRAHSSGLALFAGLTIVTVMYGFSEHAAYRPFYALVFVYLAVSVALSREDR